jgi:hypothetical protein
LLPHGWFFGSATDHGDIHAEVIDDLSQEIGSPQKRLDQCHPQVRPGQR